MTGSRAGREGRPVPLLLAVTGSPDEDALVAGLAGPAGARVRVVRRCVDVADLLAVAALGAARVAVVADGLPRLDRDAVTRLRGEGLAVVGVVPRRPEATSRGRDAAAAADDVLRLGRLGVDRVVTTSTEAVLAAVAELTGAAASNAAAVVTLPAPLRPAPAGRLLAVWGPTGAPGRSTVALTLAGELAMLGRRVLLVDADTYGASQGQLLGLLDEAPGLLAAARAANQGTLDAAGIARHARRVAPGLDVLTGAARADRWTELPGPALDAVWSVARQVADDVVADCGFCLEQDEELVFDTAAPRRNAATLITLAAADELVAVGAASPVGLQRLLRALPEARALAPRAGLLVVLTRVRRSAAAPRELTALLADAGVPPDRLVLVPDDPAGLDRAEALGRSLTEAVPRSPARTALRRLALVSLPASGQAPATRRRGVGRVGSRRARPD